MPGWKKCSSIDNKEDQGCSYLNMEDRPFILLFCFYFSKTNLKRKKRK
jgi:hypothetical protein